jgi:hypothetical protein
VETFANKLGSRLMFHPNLLERGQSYVPADEDREQPVYIRYAYHDVDELTFNIPEGFSIEAAPDSLNIDFDFGSYSAKITPSDVGRSFHYYREIVMIPKILPADKFENYRDIMNKIWKSDNSQLVLVKN